MKAMILAAGRGERMRPLTDHCPKPLLPAHGKPLIEYHLERLAALGIRDVVINTAWLAEQFPRQLGDGSRWGLTIHYSLESEALETAGGIAKALPMLGDEPFLLVNGDVYCEQDLSALQLRGGELACLLLTANPDHHPEGDFCIDASAKLSMKRNDRLSYTFAGISVMHPGLFADVPVAKQRLLPVLERAMAHHQVAGIVTDQYWCDVGTPERLQALEARLAESRSRFG